MTNSVMKKPGGIQLYLVVLEPGLSKGHSAKAKKLLSFNGMKNYNRSRYCEMSLPPAGEMNANN